MHPSSHGLGIHSEGTCTHQRAHTCKHTASMHKQARAYQGTKLHRPWSLQLPRGQATRDSSHAPRRAQQLHSQASSNYHAGHTAHPHGKAQTHSRQAGSTPCKAKQSMTEHTAPGHQPITQIQAWRSRTHSSRLLDRAHSSRSPTDHTDPGWSAGADLACSTDRTTPHGMQTAPAVDTRQAR